LHPLKRATHAKVLRIRTRWFNPSSFQEGTTLTRL
jgi:hypothetical protein